MGYQNFYVYGAVNPLSGSHFELLLPSANTDCMNVFLEEMAKTLVNKKIMLIMDGAGWHKSNEWKVPSNIAILFLPPYSPELNPIERLWLYIKQNTIKNCIYYNIKALEDNVSEFIANLTQAEISSICNANYMFNY